MCASSYFSTDIKSHSGSSILKIFHLALITCCWILIFCCQHYLHAWREIDTSNSGLSLLVPFQPWQQSVHSFQKNASICFSNRIAFLASICCCYHNMTRLVANLAFLAIVALLLVTIQPYPVAAFAPSSSSTTAAIASSGKCSRSLSSTRVAATSSSGGTGSSSSRREWLTSTIATASSLLLLPSLPALAAEDTLAPLDMKLFIDPKGLFSIIVPTKFFKLRRTDPGDLPDEKTGKGRRGSSIFTAGVRNRRVTTASSVAVNGVFLVGVLSAAHIRLFSRSLDTIRIKSGYGQSGDYCSRTVGLIALIPQWKACRLCNKLIPMNNPDFVFTAFLLKFY